MLCGICGNVVVNILWIVLSTRLHSRHSCFCEHRSPTHTAYTHKHTIFSLSLLCCSTYKTTAITYVQNRSLHMIRMNMANTTINFGFAHLFLIIFFSCSYPIYAISIAALTSQRTHSKRSCICAKTWAFDIRRSCRCASHSSQPTWSAITPNIQSANCRWMSCTRMERIILHRLLIQIHSYRRIRPISTAATAA